MEDAYILVKQDSKLYNLKCQITGPTKVNWAAGDVFTASVKAKCKESAGLGRELVTLEVASRFLNTDLFSPGQGRMTAAINTGAIMTLAPLEWDGLAYCADVPAADYAPADAAPVGPSLVNISTYQANPFLYYCCIL
jgi:hypothetical protein